MMWTESPEPVVRRPPEDEATSSLPWRRAGAKPRVGVGASAQTPKDRCCVPSVEGWQLMTLGPLNNHAVSVPSVGQGNFHVNKYPQKNVNKEHIPDPSKCCAYF